MGNLVHYTLWFMHTT